MPGAFLCRKTPSLNVLQLQKETKISFWKCFSPLFKMNAQQKWATAESMDSALKAQMFLHVKKLIPVCVVSKLYKRLEKILLDDATRCTT